MYENEKILQKQKDQREIVTPHSGRKAQTEKKYTW